MAVKVHRGLRAIRERSGLSIKELCAALADQGVSIHEDHARNIELGRKHPSERLFLAWARVLKVKPIELLADPDASEAAA